MNLLLKTLLATCALAAFLFFRPIPALADVTLCNETGKAISAAFAISASTKTGADIDAHYAKGWFRLSDGDCETVFNGSVRNTQIGAYALGLAQGQDRTNDLQGCVDPAAPSFDLDLNLDCPFGMSRKEFRQITHAPTDDDVTYTFKSS